MALINATVLPEQYEGQGFRWELDTIFGKLHVTLRNNHEYCFTIFAKFQEQEKYKNITGDRINNYSGKWNFHYKTAESCIVMFQTELNPILTINNKQ